MNAFIEEVKSQSGMQSQRKEKNSFVKNNSLISILPIPSLFFPT